MRYYVRANQFKSERCVFDPFEMEAWSYNWWKFLECRNGKVYFNGASYSMQTSKQQRMVREKLKLLGVKYQELSVKAGLQNIPKEIENVEFEITQELTAIANPKSRSKKNKARREHIKYLHAKIDRLKAYDKLEITSYLATWKIQQGLDAIIDAQRAKAKKVPKVVEQPTESTDPEVSEPVREVVRNFTLIHGGKLI